jgi:hypothetical protein
MSPSTSRDETSVQDAYMACGERWTRLRANQVFHTMTKRIEIDINFLREREKKRTTLKRLDIKFISSKYQIADGFTNLSLVKDFDEFKPNLNLFRKLRLTGDCLRHHTTCISLFMFYCTNMV